MNDVPGPGTVYLVHFDTHLSHARHYLGWTSDLTSRIRDRAVGNGSRLLAAVSKAGIGFRVVRTWPGDRHLERKLKRRHDAAGLCPECLDARRQRKARSQKWRRRAEAGGTGTGARAKGSRP